MKIRQILKNISLDLSNKYLLYSLVLFFFIIRLIVVIKAGVYDTALIQLGDYAGYSSFANELISGFDWLFPGKEFPGMHREPVYPLFLAIIYSLFGASNFFSVYVVQAALSAFMTLLIFKLSYIVFQNKKAAFISMLWAGFYFIYLRYSGELLRETMIFYLILLLFYLFTKYAKSADFNLKKIILVAIVYTLLIHTDGRYIFYGPFLFIIFYKSFPPFIISLKKYVIFTAFVLLFTIPWTVRNYVRYGEVIVISELTLNITGDNLNPRNEHFDFNRIDSIYTTPAFDHNPNYPTESERQLILKGENPNNRSQNEIGLIKKHVYPVKSYLGRKLYHIHRMWTPVELKSQYAPFPWVFFLNPWSLKHNILSFLSYGLLIPFLFIAIYYSIKSKNKYLYILLLPIAVHFALHVITFGLERYRHPIDAFIIIIGTYGIIQIIEKLKIRKKQAKL
jgi:hypothetical protein